MGLSRSFPPSVAGLLRRTGALPVLRTVSVRSSGRAVAHWVFGPCSNRVSSVAQHSALVRTSSSLPLRGSENPKPFPREGGIKCLTVRNLVSGDALARVD
jgi:hypothetical protein